VSLFHRCFKAITGTSPVQFQKLMRLQNSRLLLVAGADVSAVGHQVGYGTISQFSREYRRQFGRPPSKDAARLIADRLDPRDRGLSARAAVQPSRGE
jgi:AraC-like DNA-binding protein